MEVIEISSKEYLNLFSNPYHIFNSVGFNELNRDKCDKLIFLVLKESKIKLGIIFGVKNNSLNSPFSAPFGGFTYIRDDVSLITIENAVNGLVEYGRRNTYSSLNITLPPLFYKNDFLVKNVNVFSRSNFFREVIDVNYHFETKHFDTYADYIWYNARKNLNISMAQNLSIEKVSTLQEYEVAYSVIKRNRESKGFPLRMSFESVLKTITIIEADFFLIKFQQAVIAAAQVFSISPNVVQVVYWGDLPGFGNVKPMNFLSYKLFEYYKTKDVKIVDIGPSTENGLPNYGLCEFKESIGCNLSLKYSFNCTLD